MNIEKIEKYLSTCPTYSHWKLVQIKNHHGICLPIFSLRSKNSSGIGEYEDLIHIIDFCKKVDMDVVQLLPINESYFQDPSPYNAISSCALDPVFLSLKNLAFLEKNKYLKEKLKNFEKYNHTSTVKHKKVGIKKMAWLKEYFNNFYNNFKNLSSYHEFKTQNEWLKPYCTFKILKKKFNQKKWIHWDKKFQNPTIKMINAILKNFYLEAEFYTLLQYLCFSQMHFVKDYATKNKILIKGDIPILINPDSADVWYYRSIFDMSHVAGAPPDDFNEKGHKWGYPLFNWQALKHQNYDWWKQKLSVISNLFHMYRIDHAVGFFRIWAILPKDKPTVGKFLPKDPTTWQAFGMEHLNMFINSSDLLPIAEDLGLIPKMVYSTLKDLGICGTKVPRWENKPLKEYEPISLTTISTHDTETLSLWWKSHKKEAKKLSSLNNWKYQKKLTFELRKKILFDLHHSNSIFHINLLQEYLALFEDLTWKNPKKERINISGVKNKKNWTYRFKPFVEEILSHEKLISTIKEIVSS